MLKKFTAMRRVNLNRLEKSEQSLFNEIIELTQEEKRNLKQKYAEVEESLEKRLAHIEDEEDSMKKAKESVASLDKIVEKADEDKIKDEMERIKRHLIIVMIAFNFVEEYKKLARFAKRAVWNAY